MFEKIWRSIVKLWRKLFGRQIGSQQKLAAIASLPPLDDIDREYLFMQLLEGVAHGWQQPRAIDFFHKIRHRVRKSDWLEWLDRFGRNLLDSPAPNYELAGRMVQLSQLDCGEIGDLAGEYGSRLLHSQSEELDMDLLPIVEFDSPLSNYIDDDDRFDLEDRMDTGYKDMGTEQNYRSYGELPPDDLIDSPAYFNSPPVEEPVMESREITIEEFADMLAKDPTLVAELAAQFGIETTDPQTIVNAVVAQMQAQQALESNSSDLSTPPPPAPEQPSPPTTRTRPLPPPPPPPSRRLEDRFNQDDSLPPQTPDRRN